MWIDHHGGQFNGTEVFPQLRVRHWVASFITKHGRFHDPALFALKPVRWTQVFLFAQALKKPARITFSAHGCTSLCRTWLYRRLAGPSRLDVFWG